MVNINKSYIDGFWTVNNKRGMGRYVEMFAKTNNKNLVNLALSNLLPKVIVYIIYIFWEQLFLQISVKIKGGDEIIYAYNSPPIFNFTNLTTHLVIHDLIFLEKQSNANLALRLMNLYRRIALSFGLKHVRTIYFVSNTIAKKFDEAYISRANKIVVYNKIQLSNYSLISEDTSPFEKSKDLNICVITGMSPNKNIDYMLSLAQHFHLMDMPITFHLIGVQKSDVRVTYPNILIYENVDEIQKNNILGNSDFLLFPSLEEGFGIPLIEAGVLKIPILCSDITIFREICGSGALFFNPEKIQDCIAKIEGLIKLKQKDQTYTSDTTRKINQFYKKCIKKYVF
jgi:glycosyltransferase involved in cell wall biosynthesis